MGVMAAVLSDVFGAELGDHSNSTEPVAPGYLPRQTGEGFTLPAVPPQAVELPSSGGPAVSIRHIVFRGNSVIGTDELDAIAAPFLQRKLTEADLEDLRQKLTRHYIDRGYINSGALLVKDAVADDAFTYELVEGRLKAIRLRGLDGLNENYVVKRLVADEDAPLNVGDIRERYQLLLEDPLFERLNARLIPDSRLGEAVLDIDVVRARPYQLTLFANNYRPPSIGENSYGLNGWLRNLTGYGDQLDLSFQGGTGSDSDGRYSVAWRMPLNYYGTVLSLQAEHGRSEVIERPLAPLNIKSTLEATDIGISQVFVLSLRHKFTVGINQVDRKNSTTLLGQPFSFTAGEQNGVTKVSTQRLWQEYSFRDEHQALVTRLTLNSSRNNLQSLTGLPPGTPEISHSYTFWLGQAQYARQVFDNGTQLSLRGTLQSSSTTLSSMDRMSVGGVNTVRGYRENQLIRDAGNIMNAELRFPVLPGGGSALKVDLIPFYDRASGKNQGEHSDVLSSAGVAGRASWNGLVFDLAVARRLKHPESVSGNGTLQDHSIHLQLSYSIF